MAANYGDRARIGMLLPSVNRAAEPQITEMLPRGVSLHTTRLRLRASDEAAINEMVSDVERGAAMLADADVDLIVFHCTAASMFAPGFDDGIIERIENATGKNATSTSKGCLEAFELFGAKNITLTTPYIQETNDREVAYLASHNVKVLSETGAGIGGDGAAMLAIEPEEWRRRVNAQDEPDSQAAFISCTAIRAVEAIEPIEADIDKPVITSNQAMLWHALRKLGIDDRPQGFGRLMAAG
jgi:maleate isomerase